MATTQIPPATKTCREMRLGRTAARAAERERARIAEFESARRGHVPSDLARLTELALPQLIELMHDLSLAASITLRFPDERVGSAEWLAQCAPLVAAVGSQLAALTTLLETHQQAYDALPLGSDAPSLDWH